MVLKRGSEWNRWDPHIHTPGTSQACEFPADGWADYVTRINSATPAVVALGITDYWSIENYVEARRRWQAQEMPGVQLLFPNVELRLSVHTEKARGINVHLLFSPDDPCHVDLIRERLRALTFEYKAHPYPCDRPGLVRLGAAHNATIADEQKKYEEGVKQFKVEFTALRDWYRKDEWLRKNCLVAVVAGTNDGTSGVKKDDAFAAYRKEVERFAHIIFSPRLGDRQFWLGESALPHEEFVKDHGGPKPCLHGCDAHGPARVLLPDDDRLCWIRAEPTFEGLRQVLFEPGDRVHIGPDRPRRPRSNTVQSLVVSQADWFPATPIELNEGLVAIIGPRGSGKTALADMIATGTDAYEEGPASFLGKAKDLVTGARVQSIWEGSDPPESPRCVGEPPAVAPRARYLSQHFVEQLCSGEGASEKLVQEIEAVVFAAIEEPERLGTVSFEDLRETLTRTSSERIAIYRAEIVACTTEIARENSLKATLPAIQTRLVSIDAEVKGVAKSLAATVVQGKEKKFAKLQELQVAIVKQENDLGTWRDLEQRLADLASRVDQTEEQAEELHGQWSQELREIGFTEVQIAGFRRRYVGDVSTLIRERRQQVAKEIDKLRGVPASQDPAKPSLPKLLAERDAVQKEIAGDAQRERQIAELQRRDQRFKQEWNKLSAEIKHIGGVGARVDALQRRRLQRYAAIFQELRLQKDSLAKLYEPLAERLSKSPEERRKLEFYLRPEIDLESWTKRGERLLDLRKKSIFQEEGAVAREAVRCLFEAWRSGDPALVEEGMKEFLTHFPNISQLLAPTATLPQFAEWLFATDHVRLNYGIKYEGTEIQRLSPGARGIVLMILYLALDELDERPLIIDQPEENLDPQSIYEVLAGYFKDARRRRQVILVTHNANLVVNTDADQVIIAQGVRSKPGALPTFTYEGGALEDPKVRQQVCRILEGGEKAFRQRERRYGLSQD
ncbi:MAG: TrlF family AAA-like ATPase [Planctomycetota bacterium]